MYSKKLLLSDETFENYTIKSLFSLRNNILHKLSLRGIVEVQSEKNILDLGCLSHFFSLSLTFSHTQFFFITLPLWMQFLSNIAPLTQRYFAFHHSATSQITPHKFFSRVKNPKNLTYHSYCGPVALQKWVVMCGFQKQV